VQEDKIKQLEQVMELMKKYRVDHVVIGDMSVTKTQHEFIDLDPMKSKPDTDEEALFWSSNS